MGGWEAIPHGRVLKKRDQDERVPGLRKRLYLTGDLEDLGNEASRVFDDDLERTRWVM